jgi:transcriptional regulator with XRE-family HTH domain
VSVSGDELLSRELADPEFASEWERTAFARAVALRVLTLRVERGLTQTGFGRLLGLPQSGISRLEAGEHLPTLGTLHRLAEVLGTSFLVEVDGDGVRLVEKAEA